MRLADLKLNPDNPRNISEEKLDKLAESIKSFPKMMVKRPIVYDENKVIIGGNMRYRAIQKLGMSEIPDEWTSDASDFTPEERHRFIMQDNAEMGVTDWDMVANQYELEDLEAWGLEMPLNEKIDDMEDGEEIEVDQSVQIEPPQEYILIMANPNSEEWEDLKDKLKLKMVRRGGYKKGSVFDDVGIERVLTWEEIKNRLSL